VVQAVSAAGVSSCSVEGVWSARDLDFAAPDEKVALAVLQALDGVDIDGFTFTIDDLGDYGRRADLMVDTPFGRPQLGARSSWRATR
jgi:hypothetical protein